MARRSAERSVRVPAAGPTLVVAGAIDALPVTELPVPEFSVAEFSVTQPIAPVPPPVMLFRHALGAVLRSERTAQGRTLQQVARESRVSVAFVSEVERGMKQPSSEVLAALSGALRLSLAEVVTRSADLLRAPAGAGAAQLRAA